jgi:Delta7-sterol 5-desaturase
MLLVHLFHLDAYAHAQPYAASTLLLLAAALLVLTFVRIAAIAAPAHFIFWRLLRDRWQHRRIQPRFPQAARVWSEFRWTLSTSVIYAVLGVLTYLPVRAGYTRSYARIADHGWTYFVLSIVLMILLHDAYFYWTHRLLHLRPLFRRFHRVHHESFNPSPWAAFSFHPVEAVISYGIVPLGLFLIPMHLAALGAYLLYMNVINVVGHLGYEVFPRGTPRHWLGRLSATSTHHNMHHRLVHWNFGLYFMGWDWLMRSNHAAYEDAFDKVYSRPSTRNRVAPSGEATNAWRRSA